MLQWNEHRKHYLVSKEPVTKVCLHRNGKQIGGYQGSEGGEGGVTACVKSVFHFCDKLHNTNNLEEERVVLATVLEVSVHGQLTALRLVLRCDRNVMIKGQHKTAYLMVTRSREDDRVR